MSESGYGTRRYATMVVGIIPAVIVMVNIRVYTVRHLC